MMFKNSKRVDVLYDKERDWAETGNYAKPAALTLVGLHESGRADFSGVPFEATGVKGEVGYFQPHYDKFLMSNVLLHTVESEFENDFVSVITQNKPKIVHFYSFQPFGVEALTATRHALDQAEIVVSIFDERLLKPKNFRSMSLPNITHKTGMRTFRKQFLLEHLSVVDRFLFADEDLMEAHIEWGLDAKRCAVVA